MDETTGGLFVNGPHGHFPSHGGHHDNHFGETLALSIDAGERTRDLLTSSTNQGDRIVSTVIANGVAIERNGRSAELATEKTAAAINVNVEKNSAAIGLSIEKIGAAGILEGTKNFSAIQLEASRNAAAVQLEATKNAAAALAAQAECCCELKELIRAENGQTRDLINTVEGNRVRDELASARAELLALRFAGNGNGQGQGNN